jgi:hypothetical protein
VGLGVGVPVAVILGLAAGWFFFGRRRMQDTSASTRQSGAYETDKGPQTSSHFSAPGGLYPVEVEDNPGFVEAPGPPSWARYELHAAR